MPLDRSHIIALIAITAITWFASVYLFDFPSTWLEAAKPFVTAITTTSFMIWLYNKELWKIRILSGWFTKQPNLDGVWKVEIKSTKIDPKTKKPFRPVKGFAQIDQSANTFCLRIYTERSKSTTVAHSFELKQSVYSLMVIYQNEPAIEARIDENVTHRGSSVYSIRGYSPDVFEGDYWTEEKSIGAIKLTGKITGEINSFKEGQDLFASIESK